MVSKEVTDTLRILEQMKQTDKKTDEIEEIGEIKPNKSSLTDKQKYLRHLMKGGHRK